MEPDLPGLWRWASQSCGLLALDPSELRPLSCIMGAAVMFLSKSIVRGQWRHFYGLLKALAWYLSALTVMMTMKFKGRVAPLPQLGVCLASIQTSFNPFPNMAAHLPERRGPLQEKHL